MTWRWRDSFEADCDVFHGTYAAIMMRGDKAWIFKEIDSPLLGWEVFGSKAEFYKDTGFVLSADATKSMKPAGIERVGICGLAAEPFVQSVRQKL